MAVSTTEPRSGLPGPLRLRPPENWQTSDSIQACSRLPHAPRMKSWTQHGVILLNLKHLSSQSGILGVSLEESFSKFRPELPGAARDLLTGYGEHHKPQD